jgi:hypothetical protein
VNAGILRRVGLLAAPDLALAIAFALAWWSPDAPVAATPTECRLIILLEGLSILVSALVGVYIEVSLFVFPLILVGCVAWFVGTGAAGHSALMFCFVWYVVSAFVNGILARRGHFGPARENPAHPHRRYDRMLLLYLATAPIVVALWAVGNSLRWAIWGTIYFTLLAAIDTVLRKPFDRIPQGILRRLKARARPEVASQIGVCFDCIHAQPAIPARRRQLIRCGLSATEPRFPEYPATPVRSCQGFRPAAIVG